MIESGHTYTVLDKGFVRYIDHIGSDRRIVEAARVSYGAGLKGDEADKKLLLYLWKHKHTSPFEMVKITFNVKLPIFVMRQWVRHRMQNLNEVSARYTELKDEFYIPKSWRKQDVKNQQGSVEDGDWNPVVSDVGDLGFTISEAFYIQCKAQYDFYQKMLKVGVAREMARMILPLNIYTEIYCCWDLKNLLHFIKLRQEGHAQWEIQEYARVIKSILIELFPWTMEAFAFD